MGSNLAYDLASDELSLDLETAIGYHLQGNHYPPVPLSMVEPCIMLLMLTMMRTITDLSHYPPQFLGVGRTAHPHRLS